MRDNTGIKNLITQLVNNLP